MDTIVIADLEAWYRIGVPDAERAKPQRLLITVEMKTDFTAAAATDNLTATIDYFAVCQRLLRFGEDREWKLLEKLILDLARTLLREYPRIDEVSLEIKKFIIPETRHVAVRHTARRATLA